MPTSKKRVNVTLPPDIEMVLEKIAQRDNVPVATKTIELIKIAIEIEEDDIWDEIASKRDKKGTKFISHDTAWS
jgi:hypothetical protein